jgi:glutathione S-transferase
LPDEAIGLVARSLSALSLVLAENPYLMGERPCGTDATMFGEIAGILTPFFDSPLRRRVQQFANLKGYVDRMMAQYYPEHSWSQCALAA